MKLRLVVLSLIVLMGIGAFVVTRGALRDSAVRGDSASRLAD